MDHKGSVGVQWSQDAIGKESTIKSIFKAERGKIKIIFKEYSIQSVEIERCVNNKQSDRQDAR